MNRLCAATLTLLVGITACDRRDADHAAPGAEQATAEPGLLSADVLARLQEQYPRLASDEPLPEPEPTAGATPDDVPQRVRDAGVLETVGGTATFYADKFEGRRTASGIPFRQNQMVAAHRGFPFGTVLRVTNTRNNRAVNVRVVDRGPFGQGANRPVIDLSRRAASELGFIEAGRTPVRIEVLEWGPGVRGAVS